MESYEPGGRVPLPAVEPGYRTVRLQGSGRRARVWLVAQESNSARFALKIPAVVAGGPATTFETRRELNILSRFGHENLLRLHTVLETDQGPGLLMEWAPGDSLARLCRVRGTLQPGEAVTVLVGIASALSYLHALGVSHGEVAPGNILFAANGKPLLADLGTARLLGAGGGPSPVPEDDVFALAAVGWLILTGRALPPAERRLPLAALMPELPPALAEAIDAGLQAEPERRPDAAEFARLSFAAAPARPLDLALAQATSAVPGSGSAERTRRASRDQDRAADRARGAGLLRRAASLAYGRAAGEGQDAQPRRPSRLLLGVAAVLVAGTIGLGAVAVAAPEALQGAGKGAAPGTANGSPGGSAAQESDPAGEPIGEAAPGAGPLSSGAQPESSAEFSLARQTDEGLRHLVRGNDPVQAARALAELRARAFRAADAELLRSVNVPRSPAMEIDQAEIAKLQAAGTVISGLVVEVVSAVPALPVQAGRTNVRAAVSMSAYEERDARGVVRNVAAVSRQDIVLVLVNSAEGWRIEDVLEPPA